jgi:hypothetical protein
MEILDVWSDLHKQVMGRQRKQVAVFPDTLKPKTERDLTVEVNVDKAIEGINKTIEQKLGSLEFFLQNSKKFRDPKFSQSVIQAIEQSTNTGDVIPLYNNIARSAHTIGLSRESLQVVQIQLQQLLPNLEAITYGLLQAVSSVLGIMNAEEVLEDDEPPEYPKSLTGASLDFLRTYAVYQFIKEEADKDNTATPELLTVEALNIAFKNAFENLSQFDIETIKERIPNANWLLSSGMKNVPDFPVNDFSGRLKAIEEELGFKIPQSLRAGLMTLPLNKQKDALAKLRTEVKPAVKQALTREQQETILSVETLAKEIREADDSLRKMILQAELLNEELDALERGVQIDAEQAESAFQLLPDPPIEPEVPNYMDYYPDDDAYQRMYADYKSAMVPYLEQRQEYDYIVGQNMFIKELLIPDQDRAERDEQIREKQEMMRLLEADARATVNNLRTKHKQIREVVASAGKPGQKSRTDFVEGLRLIVNNALPGEKIPKQPVSGINPRASEKFRQTIAGLPEEPRAIDSDEDDEKYGELMEADGRPKKGNRVETRGLGTLRKNYGFRDSESESEQDSDSEEEGDALDFDDRRNENYYTRPR